MTGLVEADEQAWRPRYIRHLTALGDKPVAGLMRWRLLEAVALVRDYAGAKPETVAATASPNLSRGAPDQELLVLRYEHLEAYIQVSMGDAISKRETVIAASARKAYVDELNPRKPVRLVDDEPTVDSRTASRWVSCPSPSNRDFARQQCLAFLEATQDCALAQAEARVWTEALAVLRAAETSLAADGAPIPVQDGATLRAALPITGQSFPSAHVGRAPLLRLVGAH